MGGIISIMMRKVTQDSVEYIHGPQDILHRLSSGNLSLIINLYIY